MLSREAIYNAVHTVYSAKHKYDTYIDVMRSVEDITNAVCEALGRPDWVKARDDNSVSKRDVEDMVRDTEQAGGLQQV